MINIRQYSDLSNEKISENKVTDKLLAFFIYASIVLPTGSIFGVNIKILSMLIFFLGLLIYKKDYVLTSVLVKMSPFIVFIILEVFYSLVFLNYDDSYLVSQSKDIFVFFLMFYVCVVYAKKICGYERLLDIIVKAAFLVGVMKIVILLYSFVSGVPVSYIIRAMGKMFGTSIMSFDVESSSISRINFTSDSILFICIFYLFMKIFRGGVRKIDYCFLFVICFSALLTMSRFQWAACAFSSLAAMLINLKKKKSFLILCLFSIISLVSLSLPSVQEMIKTRFDERIVSSSDIERNLQRDAIYIAIEKAPVLGSGVGYYIPTMIRSTTAKYSYELQIQALVMQFGIIGTLVIMSFILIPLLDSSRCMSIITWGSFISVIIIWISGAFFNPVLFSSSAGASMAAIYGIGNISWIKKVKRK
ncbi:O-antigen ligase family protein [Klebsiella pasteurii]|uniref:O-antigen ligase family protein n=1 Tax=Klebsiella pasteurii TaxID=2587529 RepID=UPI00391C9C9E